jgi:hypothetical protein
MAKPQKPGDLLVFEDHIYNVVPNRDGDPEYRVEAQQEAPGKQPKFSVRIHNQDALPSGTAKEFAAAVREEAMNLIADLRDNPLATPAWRKHVNEYVDVLSEKVADALAAGKTVWYARRRVFANPAIIEVPLEAAPPAGG